MVLFGIWLVILLFSRNYFLYGDIFSRYLLCAPGAFLTAIALYMQVPQFKQTKLKAVTRCLLATAIIFALYGILAGLIVRKAPIFPASVLNYDWFIGIFGIPVQIFRAACAVMLAFTAGRILSIFRWETQKTLRESELRFNRIAAEAPVILFIEDADFVVTFIEGKGLDALGMDSREMLGKKIADVFPESTQMEENSRQALKGREFVSTIAMGELIFETYYGPLRDDDGEITGLIGVAVDVTAHTKVHAELDKYRDEMLKAKQMVSLGAMSSNMAQELSEPLAVARVFLQRLLADIGDSDEHRNDAKKLKDSLAEIGKAATIIDRFYADAHITPKPKAEPIDLYRMVQRITAVFAESAQYARLQVVTMGMDVVPCMRISSREIEQLFFILIQNAIEAADGRKTRSLTISCEIGRGEMLLQFADTCEGISQKKLKDIFEPFSMSGQKTGSAGLGLAIAKRIVDAYDGKINAQSQPGEGTTFTVKLPIEDIY